MRLLVSLLVCAALWRRSWGQTETATSATNATAHKRVIRIASLLQDVEPFTPMKFIMSKFNANRTLLPDFEVAIDAFPFRYDDRASAVEVVRILNDDTPTYHAIVGPWSRQDCLDMAKPLAMARVLHVHQGDNTVLSNREIYPYTFRTLRSIQGIQTSWFYIAASNNWHTVASVWLESDTWSTSNDVASQMNVTNYPTLAELGQASWAVEAWQKDIIGLIRSLRVRVVLTYVDLEQGWQLICRVHRSQLLGVQYFATSSWGNGWWLAEHDAALGDCTSDEMYLAAAGHLVTLHTPVAPGLQFLGALSFPALGGDQSQIPLTCMPSLTPHEFYNGLDHQYMAYVDGFFTDANSALLYMGYAGGTTDQVCAAILGLHDAIYNKGVSIDSIEQRDPVAFQTLIESVERVTFQGPTGPFRFYNNSGDPEYLYFVINQHALPGIGNDTFEISAVVTYPDGPDRPPRLEIVGPLGLRWRDGSSGLGPNNAGFFPDCGAENAVLIWDECVPCSQGSKYDYLLGACRTCPAGEYQNRTGSADCIAALPGWYVADTVHPLEATLCPRGHECPQERMTQPVRCRSGEFAGSLGQPKCELCPVGEYQPKENSTECLRCGIILAGSTTSNLASSSPEACICPSGTYRPVGQDTCVTCLEGMTCPEGSDEQNLLNSIASRNSSLSSSSSSPSSSYSIGPYPVPSKGYMTIVAKPLEVYQCIEEQNCPGGSPGTCARYRDAATVACGDCIEDSYEAGSECEPCGTTTTLPIIGAGIGVVTVVMVATILVNKDVHKAPAASLMIVAVSGLLFTSIQNLGVFKKMAIPWGEPIKSILEATQLLSFDLKLLKISCVVGVNPVRSFALRQTFALLAIPFVLVTLIIKWAWLTRRKKTMRIDVELSNTIGTLYSIFFISIIISAMDPFICYRHPGGNGESVQSAPSLLCFEGGDHTAMVIIGLVALCVIPIPFLAICILGVIKYAQSVTSRGSQHFLHAMRFLFFRYSPDKYYFQLLVMLRSLLLCSIPALFRDQASTQVLFMCIVLGWYTFMVEEMRPWRATLCTPLDVVMTLLLLITLVCGALYIQDSQQKDILTILCTIVLIGLAASALMAIGYAVWRRLSPRPYYNFFLCHHKAHAAAQARYMKTVLVRSRRNLHVFIDSDDLHELDALFDIVKCRVRHLVVYLTSDTLKRPWCAGEVVTALRAQICITRLNTPSFIPPTSEQCENPETYLDIVGCNLSEYGIHWEDVTSAFHLLLGRGIPQIDMDVQAPGTRRFENACATLLNANKRLAEERVPSLTEVSPGSIFVSTYTESDEAIAAGGILVARISENVFRVCEQGLTMLADYKPDFQQTLQIARTASIGVVLLSAGCLQSLEHISIICELMHLQGTSHAPAVISVCAPSFEFPAPAALEKLCATLPALEKAYGEHAKDLLKAFFKHISISLPTHASQDVLNMQADEVFRRIKGFFKPKQQPLALADSGSGSNARPSAGRSGSQLAGLAQRGNSIIASHSSLSKNLNMNTIFAATESSTGLKTPDTNLIGADGLPTQIPASPTEQWSSSLPSEDDHRDHWLPGVSATGSRSASHKILPIKDPSKLRHIQIDL